MVTIDPNTEKWTGRTDSNGVSIYYRDGKCLSTDTKPTIGWANGSTLIEMDTSKVFMLDESNSQWREFS